MNKLIFLFLIFLPFAANAQNIERFVLSPNASFNTKSGADFIVVPIENKSAHEIYQIIGANIGSLFNDPSKVMTGMEDSYIKVRAIIPVSQREVKLLGQKTLAESKGYVQIEIRIKDGRVRVSAPKIEDDIWIDGFPQEGSFANLVSQWYKPEKKDKKRLENEEQIVSLEDRVNAIIDGVLGLTKGQENIDDW